jgi:hypothetical protein
MPVHTKRAEMSHAEALAPGWALEWMAVNRRRRQLDGTNGLIDPVLVSQRRRWPPTSKELTFREE